MSRHDWGPEGPPPGAYSQVKRAERFRPLHQIALELLDRFEQKFDVQRQEGQGFDPSLERVGFARSSISLRPTDPAAASVTIAFTTFPGLRVRCGKWLLDSFPSCGCDACPEDLDSERERLTELLEAVVRGQFEESVTIPWIGAAHQAWSVRSERSHRGQRGRIASAVARELVGTGPRTFAWKPWPLRRGSAAA